jgi:hypothetical protein
VGEIKKYCSAVEEGEGKLAECISDLITESEITTDGEAIMLPHYLMMLISNQTKVNFKTAYKLEHLTEQAMIQSQVSAGMSSNMLSILQMKLPQSAKHAERRHTSSRLPETLT